jgi:hypothetical protein
MARSVQHFAGAGMDVVVGVRLMRMAKRLVDGDEEPYLTIKEN